MNGPGLPQNPALATNKNLNDILTEEKIQSALLREVLDVLRKIERKLP